MSQKSGFKLKLRLEKIGGGLSWKINRNIAFTTVLAVVAGT